MKKTLCACMAAVLALASLPVLGVSAEETTYALGDVDMDGVVTNDDATMISRYVLGYITLTEEQLKLADVNEDGVVDLTDVTKLYNEKQIYVLGDVDMDGVVTGHDTAMVSRYVLGYITLKEEQLKLADVNEDGVVDLTDVTKLYNEKQIYVLGDVDMDGVVTGHDTAMVSRYVLDDTYTLTEKQLKLADVNEDGVVDQADADKLYTEMQVYPLGDIDMSGMAEVGDTSDILVYYAKMSAGQNVELTAVQKNLADVDLNGIVDITDACYNLAGYARAAAGQKAYNRDNEKQYYYAPVKIVIQDPDDPNYTGDLEPDTVYVPKTKA